MKSETVSERRRGRPPKHDPTFFEAMKALSGATTRHGVLNFIDSSRASGALHQAGFGPVWFFASRPHGHDVEVECFHPTVMTALWRLAEGDKGVVVSLAEALAEQEPMTARAAVAWLNREHIRRVFLAVRMMDRISETVSENEEAAE